MEVDIIKIQAEHDHNTGGNLVTATLSCRQCGSRYSFIFRENEASIIHKYQSDVIARQYVERCAPVLCTPCLIAEPPRFDV